MKRFIDRCLLAIVLFATLESAFAQAPAGGRGGRGGRGGGPPSMLQISTDPGPAAEMVKAALDVTLGQDDPAGGFIHQAEAFFAPLRVAGATVTDTSTRESA